MAAVEPGVHYYTEDHEWLEHSDGVVTIGISDHAQEQLGDLVFVGEFPAQGAKVTAGEVIAVVESVKASSEVFAPVGGVVEEVNADVEESPELVNQDPEGDGWLVRLRVTRPPEAGNFMDAEAYAAFCQG